MAIIGSTITVEGRFADEYGTPVNLDSAPLLTVYDANRNIVAGVFTCEHGDTGYYFYDYVVPDGERDLYLEIAGILDGDPVVVRQVLTREWHDREGGERRTLAGVLAEVDGIKINQYSNDQKTQWLNRLEGRIQTEIYGVSEESDDFIQYEYHESTAPTIKLLVPPPYDDIYALYLCAQIDYWQRDWAAYSNVRLAFNAAFADYQAYYRRQNEPMTKRIENIWG